MLCAWPGMTEASLLSMVLTSRYERDAVRMLRAATSGDELDVQSAKLGGTDVISPTPSSSAVHEMLLARHSRPGSNWPNSCAMHVRCHQQLLCCKANLSAVGDAVRMAWDKRGTAPCLSSWR